MYLQACACERAHTHTHTHTYMHTRKLTHTHAHTHTIMIMITITITNTHTITITTTIANTRNHTCSCRPQWALFLTSTLLHGLLHGVNPTTLTVVWCKHYNNKSVPMELYNLRHSKKWTVLFLSKNLQVRACQQFFHRLLKLYITL